MELSLWAAIFEALLKNQILAEATIFFGIFVLLAYGFKNYVKPMYDRINQLPTEDRLVELIDATIQDGATGHVEISGKIDRVLDMLRKLQESLDKMENMEKDLNRSGENISRDIEQVKALLQQFHGHMMYSGQQNRRTGDYGNRELR